MKVDLILKNCSELLTLKAKVPKNGKELQDLGIIYNGEIAIKDGRIVAVGEGNLKLASKKVIDCSNKVVLPGFVDCHTHLVFAGSREGELELKLKGKSYLEILEEGYGIYSTVKATRKCSFNSLKELAGKRLVKVLSKGTTTIEIKSGYGLDLENELKSLRVIKALQKEAKLDIISTFLGAHAIPLEYKKEPVKYVRLLVDKILPRVAKERLAEFCDVFCEKGVFTVEETKEILSFAKKLGLDMKIHADEFTRSYGAELAAELNATSADHLIESSERGIKALARKGIIGVLLPGASFTNFMKYANARKYIELGLPIALGTDFNPSCWIDNLGLIIALACYKMKLLPSEAIAAATINAAFAVNKAQEVGSIEPGKKADLLVLDVANYQAIPYQLGLNVIEKVIKDGVVIT
jgi:imidazolonepropionase